MNRATMRQWRDMVTGALAIGTAALPLSLFAHGNEARMVELLDWKKLPNVTRVFGANRSSLEDMGNSSLRASFAN